MLNTVDTESLKGDEVTKVWFTIHVTTRMQYTLIYELRLMMKKYVNFFVLYW